MATNTKKRSSLTTKSSSSTAERRPCATMTSKEGCDTYHIDPSVRTKVFKKTKCGVTMRRVYNEQFQLLPYYTESEMCGPYYVAMDGACSIRNLPSKMSIYVLALLESYIEDQREIMEKKSKAKPPKPVSAPEPYHTAKPGAYSIKDLSEEILLSIFCLLDSKTLIKSVNRVCKRWRRLSKDNSLWRDVDLSFQPLGAIQARRLVREHCNSQHTKRLALTAVDNRVERKKSTKFECFSPGIVKEMKAQCPSLESFYLSHDQIFQVTLRTALPSTLTHLSLPYCNLSVQNFEAIFTPVLVDGQRVNSRCVLNKLKYLDLTGTYVPESSSVGHEWTLPPVLETLILRDTLISLHHPTLIGAIANHTSLKKLDLGLSHLSLENLELFSVELNDLEVLNLAGCLISGIGATITYTLDYDANDWYSVWIHGFKSLTKLNVRNVTQNSGKKMPYLEDNISDRDPANCIDTDGAYWGDDWSDAELMDDPLEETKFDIKERTLKEFGSLMSSFGDSIDDEECPYGPDCDQCYLLGLNE